MMALLTPAEVRRRVMGREIVDIDSDEPMLPPEEGDTPEVATDPLTTIMPAPNDFLAGVDAVSATNPPPGSGVAAASTAPEGVTPSNGAPPRTVRPAAGTTRGTTPAGNPRPVVGTVFDRLADRASAAGTEATSLNLADKLGSPIRPLGDAKLGEMSPIESMYHLPFMESQLGGMKQASRNLLKMAGINVDAGNPYAQFLESLVTPMFYQVALDAANKGENPLEQDIGGRILGSIQSGQTSAVSNPMDVLRQLGEKLQATGNGEMTGSMALMAEALADPDTAASVIGQAVGPTVNPFLRGRVPGVLRSEISRYRGDAPSNPNLGPLSYLVGRMG
jgi:hypothetical protein